MMKHRWLIILAIGLLLIPACNLPLLSNASQSTPFVSEATTIAQAANATIFAQATNLASGAPAATATALEQGVGATATAQAANASEQAVNASATAAAFAQSANATTAAQAVNATAQALSANATAFAQAAYATSLAQAATATAQAAIALPPTPVPISATRIDFATGATSANVDGVLKKGRSVDYVIRALGGQTMLVTVYSPNNDVYLGITGLSDGIPLLRTVAGETQFTGNLSGTQDYLLTLFSPNEKSNYTLQVIIPVRIKFRAGGNSASVQGYLAAGNTNFYLLKAMGGQTMTVKIDSPNNDIFLTIYGMNDGNILIRYVAAATQWSGVLPSTQDYMIEARSTGASSNYTLTAIVP